MLVFPLFRAVLEDLAYGPGPVCSSVCCDDSGQHLLGCFCLQERQVCAQTQVRGTNPLNTRCCLVKWASYYTLFIPFNFSYMGTRTQTYKHIIISRLNTNRESNCLCRVRAFLIRSTWLTDVSLGKLWNGLRINRLSSEMILLLLIGNWIYWELLLCFEFD